MGKDRVEEEAREYLERGKRERNRGRNGKFSNEGETPGTCQGADLGGGVWWLSNGMRSGKRWRSARGCWDSLQRRQGWGEIGGSLGTTVSLIGTLRYTRRLLFTYVHGNPRNYQQTKQWGVWLAQRWAKSYLTYDIMCKYPLLILDHSLVATKCRVTEYRGQSTEYLQSTEYRVMEPD